MADNYCEASDVNFFKDSMKSKSYRITGQRLEILTIFQEGKNKHLSAEEVHEGLQKKDCKIGIATVYRTVALLEKLGLISRINLDDGCIRYQYTERGEKHGHHHLVCDICGSVQDLQEDLLDGLEAEVLLKNGFMVYNHSVKLTGLCKECMKKLKNNFGNEMTGEKKR